MTALLAVKVQARAKNPGVQKLAAGTFRVRVLAAPEKGRANREVIERLAEFLGVPRSCLKIVRGETSPDKQIKVIGAALERL